MPEEKNKEFVRSKDTRIHVMLLVWVPVFAWVLVCYEDLS